MKKLYSLLILLLSFLALRAQDAGVTQITSPVSGCNLSATEQVTVRIFNYGSNITTPFNVSYTINGGAPVTETISATILTNSTYTYTFTTPANLSTAGSFTFTAYTSVPGDINPTNDAVTGYVVTSDPPSVGGSVSGSTNVCISGNSGTLNLSGHSGAVQRWEYSTDNGLTFITISNTTTSQSYNNITTNTLFRAVVKSGSCPEANSTPATITIDSTSLGGTVSGTTTVCITANSGTLTLSGRRGSVLYWQQSTNGGATWTNIANTATTQTYLNLTTTTRFRAVVQNGSCPAANSTQATITVSPNTVPGTISPDTIEVCSGTNSGTFVLSGQVGAIQRWQYSTNGSTWTNVSNTTTTLNFTNIAQNRFYRAQVKSGACPLMNSDTSLVRVNPGTVPGTAMGSTTACVSGNSGIINLTGHTGDIIQWEQSSDAGLSWTTIADTSDTITYSNLTQTTSYRAFVQNAGCAAVYSSAATINIDSLTNAGSVTVGPTVCSGDNGGTVSLAGNRGSVIDWESSTDGGVTWNSIGASTTSITFEDIVSATSYRAIVQNGSCPADTSSPGTINVDSVSVGGVVDSSATICSGGSGTLMLTGATGAVQAWEYSTDGGSTWIAISNNTSSLNYSNLTSGTSYRALVKSGVCPSAYSSAAIITINAPSLAGVVYGGSTVCVGSNSGTLTLVGFNGAVLGWEASTDTGATWSPIANTSYTHSFNDIDSMSLYRAIVQNGVCPADTSDFTTVAVDLLSVGGVVSSSDTVCGSANSGTLVLSGETGVVRGWEMSSDGGITWLSLANTSSMQGYNNLQQTTTYRTLVKNGVCPAVTSSPATIVVDQPSNAGEVPSDISACSGVSGLIELENYTGVITGWQTADSTMAWMNVSNSTDTISFSITTGSLYFRVIVQNGICPEDTSEIIEVSAKSVPVANAGVDTTITAGQSVQLSGSGGMFYSWSPVETLSMPSTSSPVATPAETTTYELIVTDLNGCSDSDSVVVTVVPFVDFTISPPSLITPNGDNINDTWQIDNLSNFSSNEVRIFNRQGQLVFSAANYDNSWGGTYNGKVLPDGTYYYQLSVPELERPVKGTVNILKGE